jgi:hypothetical protein
MHKKINIICESNPQINAAIPKLTLDNGREKYKMFMELSNQKDATSV